MNQYLKPLFYSWLLLGSLTSVAQLPTFNQYSVSVYKRSPARIIIKGNALAERYRTIIRDTYYSKAYMNEWHGSSGLNFAGHYCFVYWGCGSPCKQSAVVDLKTGIVYPGVSAAFEYNFKRNSRLIVVDPDAASISSVYKTEYWKWDDANKKFSKIK